MSIYWPSFLYRKTVCKGFSKTYTLFLYQTLEYCRQKLWVKNVNRLMFIISGESFEYLLVYYLWLRLITKATTILLFLLLIIILSSMTDCGSSAAALLKTWPVPSTLKNGKLFIHVACFSQVDLTVLVPLQIKTQPMSFSLKRPSCSWPHEFPNRSGTLNT